MKKIFSGIIAVLAFVLSSCEAFEDGTVSSYDYSGYNPDYYNPIYYNNYPYYNPWNNPWSTPYPPRPIPPTVIVPPQNNVPARPSTGNPTNPQAPSFNGQRPGANNGGGNSSGNSTIVPPANNNPFGAQSQNWTTMPSTNNGRRPGSR